MPAACEGTLSLFKGSSTFHILPALWVLQPLSSSEQFSEMSHEEISE